MENETPTVEAATPCSGYMIYSLFPRLRRQSYTVRPWSSQAWQHRPVLQSRVNFEASPGYADTMKSWGVPQMHSMKSRV